MELAVFVVGALIIAVGAMGVVTMRNPVHCALSLVMTLFGVAVLFVQLDAHFLAVVQVIVYAGAIVILFLFVIMLLGVDRADDLGIEPIKGQRPMALLVGVALIASALAVIVSLGDALTGQPVDHQRARARPRTTPRRWASCSSPATRSHSRSRRCC